MSESGESFESFYRREFRSVVALAYALSGSRSGAEDLAQDAFIAAHARWDKISRYDKPEAWVRRVLSNKAVSAYRTRAAEARALARMASSRPIPEMEPADEEFWAGVRTLPNNQARAITLHYLEDRSVAEIAEVMGCSPSTAKVHLFRGRQRLAQSLGLEVQDE